MVNARIEKGRVLLGPTNRASLLRQVGTMADGEAVVIVERSTRTLAQNRYLWGIVYAAIADHTGNTPEVVHEFCKDTFNPVHFSYTAKNGQLIDELVGGSTASLAKDAFSEYTEKVRGWAAADLGIVIPDPGETWNDSM